MKVFILFIFLLLIPGLSPGQIDRISEEEIQKEARFLDALQLKALERNQEALISFLEFEKSDPGNDVVNYEIAKLYYLENEKQSAEFHIKKAIASNPEKIEYRQFLIDLLSSAKDFVQLNQQLEFIIESDHFHQDNYYKLARSLEELGDFKEAIKILKKLEDRVGYDARLGKSKVRIYKKEKNHRKMIKELDRLTESFPYDVNLLLHKAVLLNSINEREKAFKCYLQILEADPDHVGANLYVNSKNKNAKTENDFLSSLEALIRNERIPMDEKIKQLIPYVPRLHKESDLTNKMLELVEIMQELYPKEAKVNALHGDVYFNSDDLANAIKYYNKTLNLNKGVFMVWKQLMMSLDHIENYKDLKETAMDAISYYPNQAVCYYYAGKACIELEQENEAIEWLEEGILLSNKNSKLWSEISLLFAYTSIRQDNPDRARSHFENSNKNFFGPSHSFYYEVLGDIQNIEGNLNKALEAWENSLSNGGRKDRLEEKIMMLKKKMKNE